MTKNTWKTSQKCRKSVNSGCVFGRFCCKKRGFWAGDRQKWRKVREKRRKMPEARWAHGRFWRFSSNFGPPGHDFWSFSAQIAKIPVIYDFLGRFWYFTINRKNLRNLRHFRQIWTFFCKIWSLLAIILVHVRSKPQKTLQFTTYPADLDGFHRILDLLATIFDYFRSKSQKS